MVAHPLRSAHRIAGIASHTSRDVLQEDGHATHRVLPHRVERRGYLIPGDPPPPDGVDLLDYRGLQGTPNDQVSADGEVALGLAIDLDSGIATVPFAVPMAQFYRHATVVAPEGSGESSGVVVPWVNALLRAGASVVVLDAWGTLGARLDDDPGSIAGSSAPAVRTVSWTMRPEAGSMSWNPLHGIGAHDLLAIEGVKSAILGDEPSEPRPRAVYERNLRVFTSLLRMTLVSRPNATLADVAEPMTDRPLFEALATASIGEAPDWDEVSECRSLRVRLAPFTRVAVRARTTATDVRADEIGAEPTLAIIGAELDLGLESGSQTAAALFVNRLIGHLQSRNTLGDVRPVVLVLDEAPAIAKRIDLARVLSGGRAARMGIVVVCRDAAHFGDELHQRSIFGSCDLAGLLPGASIASIQRFRERVGLAGVEMLGDRELAEPPFGENPAIIHSRSWGLPPIAVDLHDRARMLDGDPDRSVAHDTR